MKLLLVLFLVLMILQAADGFVPPALSQLAKSFALSGKRRNKRKVEDAKASSRNSLSSDNTSDAARAFLDSRKAAGVTEVTSSQSPEKIASQVKSLVDSQKSTVNTLTAVKTALKDKLFVTDWKDAYDAHGYVKCSQLLGDDLRSEIASSVARVDLSHSDAVQDGEVELSTGGYFKNLSKEDYDKSPKAIEFIVAASKSLGDALPEVNKNVQQNRVGGDYSVINAAVLTVPEEADVLSAELIYFSGCSNMFKLRIDENVIDVERDCLVLIDRKKVPEVERVYEGEADQRNEYVRIWMYE
ncbi:hypothetical protein TrLO_g11987 [Triparma laevis f. longispina]|uniref:Uncharacterized protein n=1 Tax=Triparma laevis f. longispina TaxID=1714387 RepID=A0A9W7F886_9STRA|nr:hypothetical protein TrLO_g11987 [Triparma laevis f. longispina]